MHHCTYMACRPDTNVEQRVCGWVDAYVYPLVVCRLPFRTKDTKEYDWRLYIGISSASPCSGIVYSNRAVVSVHGEQPKPLQQSGLFGGSHRTPLDNKSIRYNPIPARKPHLVVSFRTALKWPLVLALPPCIPSLLPSSFPFPTWSSCNPPLIHL